MLAKEKEVMDRCEDAIEGSPTCEGVLIYDDLERKQGFLVQITKFDHSSCIILSKPRLYLRSDCNYYKLC